MNLPRIGAYKAAVDPNWCAALAFTQSRQFLSVYCCRTREVALSIHVALNHVTQYRYDRLVSLGPQSVRLRPAPHCRTRILGYSLSVQPAKHFINWQQDPEANYLARLTFPEKTRELRIEVDLVAEMSVFNPFDFFLEPYAQQFPFNYEAGEARELAPYLTQLPGHTARWRLTWSRFRASTVATVDFLVDLNMRLSRDIRYLIRMEPGVQTPEDDAGERIRIVPRLELAVGTVAAAPGARNPLRVGLPHPAHPGCQIARRPVRAGRGLHRPARLVRSLSAGCGLDRARSDLRTVGR